MNDKKLRGRAGEAAAADWLRRRGWEILGLNYACRFGEIDIIARDGRFVVFCEVKLRRSAAFAQAREYVTAAKQERLRTTAALWLSQNETDLQPRFDVLEVYDGDGGFTVRHIENAFE